MRKRVDNSSSLQCTPNRAPFLFNNITFTYNVFPLPPFSPGDHSHSLGGAFPVIFSTFQAIFCRFRSFLVILAFFSHPHFPSSQGCLLSKVLRVSRRGPHVFGPNIDLEVKGDPSWRNTDPPKPLLKLRFVKLRG